MEIRKKLSQPDQKEMRLAGGPLMDMKSRGIKSDFSKAIRWCWFRLFLQSMVFLRLVDFTWSHFQADDWPLK